MKKFEEFNKVNENYEPGRREVTPETTELQCSPDEMFCPHCGIEQAEVPTNLLSDNIHDTDCDECGKNFTIDEVYYVVCAKND